MWPQEGRDAVISTYREVTMEKILGMIAAFHDKRL